MLRLISGSEGQCTSAKQLVTKYNLIFHKEYYIATGKTTITFRSVIKQKNLETSTLLSSVISLTASVAPTIPVN